MATVDDRIAWKSRSRPQPRQVVSPALEVQINVPELLGIGRARCAQIRRPPDVGGAPVRCDALGRIAATPLPYSTATSERSLRWVVPG